MKRIFAGFLAIVAVVGAVYTASALNITGTETTYRNSIFQVGILRISREESITAFSGGGQTSAYQLTAGLSRVTTVAAGNDSVKLPVCGGGKTIVVINAAASNSMNVYGQTGDTINALSANTAFAVAANKMVIFSCAIDGAWYSLTTS